MVQGPPIFAPRSRSAIEDLLGEGAVGGELAAIEGDEAAGAVGNAGERRAPREPARLLLAIVLQRADAGEAPHDVGVAWPDRRTREVAVIGIEQIGLLLQGAACGAGIAFLRHFGGADDEEAPVEPGHDEDHAVVRVLQAYRRRLRPGSGMFSTMWLPRTSRRRPGRRGDRAHGIDLAATKGPAALTMKRASTRRLHPALVELDRIAVGERLDRRHGAAVQNVGAAGARIEQHGEHEPRIVGLAVMIVEHGVQVFAAEPRQRRDLLRA